MYKDIFESSPDGVFVADSDTKVFLTANSGMCRMSGYPLGEIQNMTVMDIHPEQDFSFAQEQCTGLQQQQRVVANNVPIQKKDGTLLYADVSYSPMLSEGRKYLVGIFRDSTARKQHDRDALNKKNLESLGVLAGGIAHDFNNILTGILGNVELAKMVSENSEAVLSFLEKAMQSSLRAKDLARQLLTFSKGGEPVKQVVSLCDIMTGAVELVLHGSSVTCDCRIPDDLWQVEIDPGQISQVLQQVLLNARYAMADGGVIVVSCENIIDGSCEDVSLRQGEKYTKVNIVDHGGGIPEEHLDHIFDPYFSTRQVGHGMGLAICHSIINKHDGGIAVQSEVDKGTVISIYLPASTLAVAGDGRERVRVVSGDDSIQAERKATIMVMDDESMVREVTRELLEQFGHTVLLVENGYQAIEKYEKGMHNGQTIDLIIMDLTIPGSMGGEDAVKEILRINPEAKVIVASGYSCDPIMEHCRQYGFLASITKPFQLAELDKVVHESLTSAFQN